MLQSLSRKLLNPLNSSKIDKIHIIPKIISQIRSNRRQPHHNMKVLLNQHIKQFRSRIHLILRKHRRQPLLYLFNFRMPKHISNNPPRKQMINILKKLSIHTPRILNIKSHLLLIQSCFLHTPIQLFPKILQTQALLMHKKLLIQKQRRQLRHRSFPRPRNSHHNKMPPFQRNHPTSLNNYLNNLRKQVNLYILFRFIQ